MAPHNSSNADAFFIFYNNPEFWTFIIFGLNFIIFSLYKSRTFIQQKSRPHVLQVKNRI